MINSWAIGIPTFRRPDSLRRLLESLSVQSVGKDLDLTILLVDNDPNRSALPVSKEFKDKLRIEYSVERRPGVVHVRNAILELAQRFGGLIFLDDDQIAPPQWFSTMLAAHSKYPKSVITAPSHFTLPDGMKMTGLARVAFSVPDREAGSRQRSCGTGNTLLPIKHLSPTAKSKRFDEKFARSGGEDTRYFGDLVRDGLEIRWWPAAFVEEPVPAGRASTHGLQRRFIRLGFVNAQLKMEYRSRLYVAVGYVVKWSAGFVVGKLARRDGGMKTRAEVWRLSAQGGLRAVVGQELSYYGGENG